MKKKSMMGFLGLAVLTGSAFAKMPKDNSALYVPGEVLVKVKPGFGTKFLSRKGNLSATVKKELKLLSGDYYLLKSHNKSTVSLVSSLESLPEVSFAEPNYIYRAFGISNRNSDPLYGKLWGLKNTGSNEPDRNGGQSPTPGVRNADIDAEKAWNISKGSQKVVVAVIDTGVDYNHPDLKNKMWKNLKEVPANGIDDDGNGYIDDYHGWNANKDNGNPLDGNGHGTHCAGTIGAEHNNGMGVAGVMKDASLMAVKFLSDEGSGTLADAVEAINYATKMNVDIMSNSWGGGGYSQALKDSIEAAKNRGIIFVAAAGNDSSNNDQRASYPASYEVDNVISVASHTAQDVLSSFSNYGRRSVHVAAPGSNILSTTPNGEYKVYSGTSMATPHVSGVIGLLLSNTGRLPVLEVRNRLMATTVPVAAYRKTTASGGRVSAYNLLTNTRIPRQEPDERAWRSQELREPFESVHPYLNNSKITKTYTFPGAKYVKFVIERFDTEAGYDFITFKDAKGAVFERVSGTGQKYVTDFTETDTVTVEFTTDSSQVYWGVLLKEVQVIY